MADRLIVDLGEDGTVTVGALAGGDLPSALKPAELSWPLGDEALEDLRWYLEDYLTAPFGVYEDRGARISAGLDDWGRRVFTAVFGSGPARDAYLRMRARGDVELVFRSASPSLLGLPWELMADPGRERPLALEVTGVGRSLQMAPDAAQTVTVPDGRLRVLMVISRPSGAGDVGYRMIARPLLERLEAVRGTVDLVVLRPPTLDELRAELRAAVAAGLPYQVVHFDGHGVMPGRRGGAGGGLTFGGEPGEGVLVFEKPDGGADRVPASRVAEVLADAKVPVVVLNACQSGAVGKELEAAVATRLLGEGIAAVVAMAYSVYAVAAAEFMAAFYERLFAGGTVSGAVTAGRQQMWRNPGRPSPKGALPLADWLVPVHYFRRDVSFPQVATPRPSELPPLAEALAQVTAAGSAGPGDLEAAGGVFVGRDALFYDLEAAARLQGVVVLVGPGGTGKTELAKAFARWWRDTGAVERPEFVFWHSFEPGVASFGLDGVISEIGMRLWGEQFLLLETDQRRAVVRQALAQHRMLLVWDNFESVRSMPDPGRATPPLDDDGCAELREFLAGVAAGGTSSVLVTSRAAEDWLGDVRRIRVGGLAVHEAAEYADLLMAPYPAARARRKGRAFGELLEWLDGHPLSMRLTLPRLEAADPADLLAGLKGTTPLPAAPLGAAEGARLDRLSSLGACITYSFAHLGEQTRRLLPAISLLHGIADEDLLMLFSAVETLPARFASVSKPEWTAVLEDASRVGLLTGIGAGMYEIHPALPGYLAAGWHADNPGGYDQEREACEHALRSAAAAFSEWLTRQIQSGNAALAYAVIGLQRRTLGVMLGHALDHQAWGDSEGIVRTLDAYWDARGLGEEAAAWADRILAATTDQDQAPPEPAESLWLYTTIHQANRQESAGRPDQAAQTYRRALTWLEDRPATNWTRSNISVIYHQLGLTSQNRGQMEDADNWYRKSLAIEEELGNRPGMASTYHQLGITAQNRGRLDEADDWYRKSLAIKEELGNHPGMALTYAQLGLLAESRNQALRALEWNIRCVSLFSEFPSLFTGSGPSALVRLTRQLGMPALERIWQQVTGQPLLPQVRDYVTSHRDEDSEGVTEG